MEWSLTGLPLPITVRPPSPLSDEELLEFSSKNSLYRIEQHANGELSIMTPVGGDGGRFEAIAIFELRLWARDYGGETFSSNAGFRLADGSRLSPDASWIAADRWASLTPAQRKSFPPLCPDFLIEILSESDSLPVLRAKMDVWMANGAKLAWMIDPYAATVTIYRPGREPELLERPGSIEAEEPVPGFRLSTALLWPVD